jgi:hypothetical protein
MRYPVDAGGRGPLAAKLTAPAIADAATGARSGFLRFARRTGVAKAQRAASKRCGDGYLKAQRPHLSTRALACVPDWSGHSGQSDQIKA